MRILIVNESLANKGVHTKTGIKWVKPGCEATVDVADTRMIDRMPGIKIVRRDDEVPVGDMKPMPADLKAKIEQAQKRDPIEASSETAPAISDQKPVEKTDDDSDRLTEKRREYQQKVGKRAFHKWDIATLQSKIDEAE